MAPDKRGEAGKATISSEQALNEYLGCDSFFLLNLGTPSEGWMLPCLLNLDRDKRHTQLGEFRWNVVQEEEPGETC